YHRSTSHNINNLLPQLVSEVPYTAIASAAGLNTVSASDLTHFNSPSATILGERYAQQMLNVQQSILPVKLIDFKALKRTNGVELKWETASEINNAWFEPERSADGKTFISLG